MPLIVVWCQKCLFICVRVAKADIEMDVGQEKGGGDPFCRNSPIRFHNKNYSQARFNNKALLRRRGVQPSPVKIKHLQQKIHINKKNNTKSNIIYNILGCNKIKKSDMNYLISGWLKTVFFQPPSKIAVQNMRYDCRTHCTRSWHTGQSFALRIINTHHH